MTKGDSVTKSLALRSPCIGSYTSMLKRERISSPTSPGSPRLSWSGRERASTVHVQRTRIECHERVIIFCVQEGAEAVMRKGLLHLLPVQGSASW